jgi:hypothetical protein
VPLVARPRHLYVVRVFGIGATAADVVAVLRRGPSGWSHVGRWDIAARRYEPGSWLHGTLYPQRCDLSADSRYLCYFAFKGDSTWELGATYIAISRLPWLTALAAWRTPGTWTRGAHFVADASRCDLGPPAAGDTSGLRDRYGLAVTAAAAYPVERRRGWRETPDTPARAATDRWDERRANQAAMARPQPEPVRGRAPWSGRARPWLVVSGGYAAHREAPQDHDPPRYELRDGPAGSVLAHLDEVQWADWAGGGELLTATTGGRLQIRDRVTLQLAWEHDLAPMVPDSGEPPAEARHW